MADPTRACKQRNTGEKGKPVMLLFQLLLDRESGGKPGGGR